MSLVWIALLGVLPLVIADPLRICVSEALSTWCSQMEEDIPEKFKCIVAPDTLRCIQKISRGEADLTNVEYAGLYIAGKHYDLKPITKELVDGVPFLYEVIAVVSKDSGINSPSDLRDRSFCHSGLESTVDWQIPIGRLFDGFILQPNCTDGDLAAVDDHFNGGCLPGPWASDPDVDRELKSSFSNLCSRCKDPLTCSKDDHYAGYEGTLNCLSEGAADVAFTKMSALKEYLIKHPDFAEKAELLCYDGTNRRSIWREYFIKHPDFPEKPELLCYDGERRYVTNSDPCVWGTVPSNAFIAKEDDAKRIRTVLLEVQSLYAISQGPTPEWYHKTFYSHPSVTGLRTTEYDRNKEESFIGKSAYEIYLSEIIYIWNDRFGCEKAVDEPVLIGDKRRGEEYETSADFCVTSDEEMAKCEDLSRAVKAKVLWPEVGCVQAASKEDCMTVVRENEAQLLVLDGGDVYKAGRYFDLQPIASELYNSSDATYYAVAVIRSDSDVTKLSELQGLRSCHTGMGSTAGWVMPVGALASGGFFASDPTCKLAESVANFFSSGSCVPGANDSEFNPGCARSEDLCRHCVGDRMGQNKCSRDSEERYSGYAGALRCLSEGKGDVAFVKHTTVPDYTDGYGDLEWSRDLQSADFKLVGAAGGTASVFSHEECNLGKVPSHQVVTGPDISPMHRVYLAKLLSDISRHFDNDSPLFRLFGASKSHADLLFKDSTTALKIVPFGDTYENVLGPQFLEAARLTDPTLCSKSAVPKLCSAEPLWLRKAFPGAPRRNIKNK